jgi:MFS family permease
MASPEENKDVIAAHVEREPEMLQEDPVDLLAHDTNVYFDVDEEKRVLRKIDWRVLPLMLGAYFLQQLDKSSLSYTSVFNIQTDAHLHGKEYSWLGSILYFAQLVMQPLGALLLVKLPTGKLISTAIFFWGVTMCGMAACQNFKQLIAARFILGSFESLIGKSLLARLHLKILTSQVLPWLLSLKCGGAVVSKRTEQQHGMQ